MTGPRQSLKALLYAPLCTVVLCRSRRVFLAPDALCVLRQQARPCRHTLQVRDKGAFVQSGWVRGLCSYALVLDNSALTDVLEEHPELPPRSLLRPHLRRQLRRPVTVLVVAVHICNDNHVHPSLEARGAVRAKPHR